MSVLHIILQIVQLLVGIGLIVAVTSQASKDGGLGGAMGGGGDAGAGNTRYKGGVEEKIDQWTAGLAWSFLITSFFVAWLGHLVARG